MGIGIEIKIEEGEFKVRKEQVIKFYKCPVCSKYIKY